MKNNSKKFSSLKRVIKSLFKDYPKLLAIVVACIVLSAVTAAIPAVFQQQVLSDIGKKDCLFRMQRY